MANIFMFSPIEVSHTVLSRMLARGHGAVVIVGGLTAVVTMPGLSGIGPLMAATRNYIFTLNAKAMPRGVYAGTVNIGAVIDRSAGFRAMTANGARPAAPGNQSRRHRPGDLGARQQARPGRSNTSPAACGVGGI